MKSSKTNDEGNLLVQHSAKLLNHFHFYHILWSMNADLLALENLDYHSTMNNLQDDKLCFNRASISLCSMIFFRKSSNAFSRGLTADTAGVVVVTIVLLFQRISRTNEINKTPSICND